MGERSGTDEDERNLVTSVSSIQVVVVVYYHTPFAKVWEKEPEQTRMNVT